MATGIVVREGALRRARHAFARWRRRVGRGPIPEELWRAAIEAARAEGVSRTAKALRLNGARLARRMRAPVPSGEFVELSAAQVLAPPEPSAVLRLTGRDGVRLDIELGGPASVATVVEVACALWRGTR